MPFMVKSNMMSAFTDFLNAQLEQRRMSMRELARQAGFSATQVSDVINEKVPASTNFVLRVALALDEDPQHLLRLAGHLPATPPPTDLSCALNDAIRQLSDTQQEAVLEDHSMMPASCNSLSIASLQVTGRIGGRHSPL